MRSSITARDFVDGEKLKMGERWAGEKVGKEQVGK